MNQTENTPTWKTADSQPQTFIRLSFFLFFYRVVLSCRSLPAVGCLQWAAMGECRSNLDPHKASNIKTFPDSPRFVQYLTPCTPSKVSNKRRTKRDHLIVFFQLFLIFQFLFQSFLKINSIFDSLSTSSDAQIAWSTKL